jgi:RNA polymerase sigma-70 factor (ECF subfamily)
MADTAATRPSLLVRIRDARDAAAWSQFVDLYAPLIYGFARRHGLQDADAADVTQDVLRAVARSARKLEYDPRRGSFRGWLFTIVRNELRDFLTRRARQARATGDSTGQQVLAAVPASEAHQSALWQAEHERQLFAWASEQVQCEVQPSTWQAFWQTAVEGKAGKDVAAALEMSVAAVYLAKSRVMARLKELIRQTETE